MASASEAPRARLSEWARGHAVLGRCIVDRLLRRDRLAAAYLARSPDDPSRLHLVWAVQPQAVVRSEHAVAGFAEAMGRLAAVEHPSLPEVEAFDAEGPAPVVVARRPAGETLRARIDREHQLPPGLVASIVSQVAAALSALQLDERRVLHRAISPEVVLLSGESVYLQEAGWLDALVTAGFVSDRAAMAFTPPGYAPPSELAFPPEPAMDAFALAVLAFECLTGQLPFGATSAGDVDDAVRAPTLPVPSAARSELPARVDAVFRKAWSVASGEHFVTAQALAGELARALVPDDLDRPTLPAEDIAALVAALDRARGEELDDEVAVDPEPTPSYGEYGALLARMDAAANPTPLPPGPAPEGSGLPSEKRTLRGGLSPVPRAVVAAEPEPISTLGGERSSVELGLDDILPVEETVALDDVLPADPEEPTAVVGDPVELSPTDLESIPTDEPVDLDEIHAPVGEQARSGIVAPAAILRVPTRAGPITPGLRAVPAIDLAPVRTPLPTPLPRRPSTPATSSPPPAVSPTAATEPPPPAPPVFPRGALMIQTASRGLAVATLAAAAVVAAGLIVAARSVDRLTAEVARANAYGPYAPRRVLVEPPVTVVTTTPPAVDAVDATAAPEALDATLTATVADDVAALSAADAGAPSAAPDATALASTDAPPVTEDAHPTSTSSVENTTSTSSDASVGSTPSGAAYARVAAALRPRVADCVEGLEDPHGVRLSLRFEGATGTVTSVRVRGLFAEPPMGPCIEEAARGVRVPPFTAATWEPSFTFPIAPPRWRPPGG